MTDSQQLGMNLPDTQPVERVDEFKFEPIKGYPMLNWRGKRPFTSTRYYPAQLKEVHGEEVDGWLNKIYWGDNLQVMSHLLKEYRGKIKLAYIDPPFDSKAAYHKKVTLRNKKVQNDQTSFEEKQYSDIWTNDEYLQFMYERLTLVRELLSTDGSLYLHRDWHKSHHLRAILDELFGSENFRNDIVWGYPGREMHIDNKFNAKHDNLLFFAKTREAKVRMKSVSIPYDKEERLKTLRRKVHQDDDGREWVWETRGQSAGQEPYKRYVDEIIEGGKALNDIWIDLQFLRGNDPQRQNYPTQKPEDLLERIIKASSDSSDIVFDCFMGSGTTQAVAMKLGRRFIGADINLGAVRITTKRLLEISGGLDAQSQQIEIETEGAEIATRYVGLEIYNVNYYDVFRNPDQAKDLLIEALEINPLSKGHLFDGEKDNRMWKIMPINRIATKADLSPLINGFDYKAFEKRQQESPKGPVEKITLVCMGHDPDLKAALQAEVKPYEIDIEVVDILRDRQDLQFKRDSEAEVVIEKGELVIQEFYPMNLLSKLSLQQENVEDWREMVESVMVDWNYDGAVLEPKTVDIPGKNELVQGRYTVPEDAGTIRIKITDLLSESLEMEVQRG